MPNETTVVPLFNTTAIFPESRWARTNGTWNYSCALQPAAASLSLGQDSAHWGQHKALLEPMALYDAWCPSSYTAPCLTQGTLACNGSFFMDDTYTVTVTNETRVALLNEQALVEMRMEYEEQQPIVSSPGMLQYTTNGNESLWLPLPTWAAQWAPPTSDDYVYSVTMTLGSHTQTVAAPVNMTRGPGATPGITVVLPPYSTMCGDITKQCPDPFDLSLTLTKLDAANNNTLLQLQVFCFDGATTLTCPPRFFRRIAYAQHCLGYAPWQECAAGNNTLPCAFGSGSGCRDCPRGAICPGMFSHFPLPVAASPPTLTLLCLSVSQWPWLFCNSLPTVGIAVAVPCAPSSPGGFVVRPLPGYYTSSEKNYRVVPCAEPQEARCIGWDIEKQRVQCGEGYDQQAPACGACAPNYYSKDGACERCPSSGNNLQFQAVPLGIAAGILAFLFLCILLLLWRLFKRYKIKVSKQRLLRLPLQYVLWLVVALQLLAQVGRASSPGLPEYMRDIFSVLQLVQLDFDGVVPPECTSGSPFPRYTAVFAFQLALFVLWVIMAATRPVMEEKCAIGKKMTTALRWLQYLFLGPMLVVYPLTLNMVAEMLECSSVPTADAEDVLVWDKNPYYSCFVGPHSLPASLAFAVAVCNGLLLPTLLLLQGRGLSLKMYRSPSSSGKGHDVAKVAGASATPPNEAPRGRCRRCCPQWCCLDREVHRVLRKQRQWVPIFGYGQPWFRPTYMYLFFVLAFLQWLPDATLAERMLSGLGRMGVIIAYAVIIVAVQPDHEWGAWRRFPRFLTSVASALVAVMQLNFVIDDAVADGNGAKDPNMAAATGTGYVEPLKTAVALPEPSLRSLVFVWITLVVILLLPIVQFASFVAWLRSLLPSTRRGGCCRSGKGLPEKDRNAAGECLLLYSLAHDTTASAAETEEQAQRDGIELPQLRHTPGKAAMGAADPMERVNPLFRGGKSLLAGLARPAVEVKSQPLTDATAPHVAAALAMRESKASDLRQQSGFGGHPDPEGTAVTVEGGEVEGGEGEGEAVDHDGMPLVEAGTYNDYPEAYSEGFEGGGGGGWETSADAMYSNQSHWVHGVGYAEAGAEAGAGAWDQYQGTGQEGEGGNFEYVDEHGNAISPDDVVEEGVDEAGRRIRFVKGKGIIIKRFNRDAFLRNLVRTGKSSHYVNRYAKAVADQAEKEKDGVGTKK